MLRYELGADWRPLSQLQVAPMWVCHVQHLTHQGDKAEHADQENGATAHAAKAVAVAGRPVARHARPSQASG